jgi:hypothetical protein
MFLPALVVALGFQAGSQSVSGNLQHWKSLIVPSASEARYEEVGWYPSMWSAVVEAQRQDKPVLLWAMNGHPLGCT